MEYSQKELEMIGQLADGWLQVVINKGTVEPLVVYRMLANDCFKMNKIGPAVDSLRRCCIAIDNAKPYRMTPEFDALIRLNPPMSDGMGTPS